MVNDLHVSERLDLENFTTAAAVGQTATVTIAVLPVCLLILTGRRHRKRD